MRVLLPLTVAVLFSAVLVQAQQGLPKSTQELSAAVERVASLTPSEINALVSQAQSGDPESQYLLALAFEDGRSVTRDWLPPTSGCASPQEQGYDPAEAGTGKTYLRDSSTRNQVIPRYGDADRRLGWASMRATRS